MKRTVTILGAAQSDVDAIFAWIAAQSPEDASAWFAAFLSASASLEEDAERCGLAAESKSFDRDVRDRVFKTRRGSAYRLLFTIVGDEVRILRVRGPGQPPLVRGEISI